MPSFQHEGRGTERASPRLSMVTCTWVNLGSDHNVLINKIMTGRGRNNAEAGRFQQAPPAGAWEKSWLLLVSSQESRALEGGNYVGRGPTGILLLLVVAISFQIASITII
jgi:hypothetical protein